MHRGSLTWTDTGFKEELDVNWENRTKEEDPSKVIEAHNLTVQQIGATSNSNPTAKDNAIVYHRIHDGARKSTNRGGEDQIRRNSRTKVGYVREKE